MGSLFSYSAGQIRQETKTCLRIFDCISLFACQLLEVHKTSQSQNLLYKKRSVMPLGRL